jgi:sulfate permease, SulP family
MNSYRPEKKYLTADLLAGLTFAVANIPTSMAHAMMATVSPVLGIYTLMVGTPVAALFTSSVYMNVSTTSALSVAVGSSLINYSDSEKTAALATLVLLVGVISLLAGVFKMGKLLRFVPNSVMVGFSNGVAVLIILGQISDLTGYESPYSNKILKTLDVILHPEAVNLEALLVGLVTIGVILIANRTRLRKISAILGLGAATALVAIAGLESVELIADVADVPSALPQFVIPQFRLIPALFLPAFSVAIVGLVQGAAVSQNFPNPDGKFPEPSRDFSGQGIANIVTGFFQGIPAGGSMSGTSLTISSGAKTRWANIFAGVFVILIVLLFSPLVEKIPMSALAGLVLLAGIQSLQIPAAQTVWQTGRVAESLMVMTFILTLIIPLQYAVLVGVAFSILLSVVSASNQVRVVQIIPKENGYPIEAPVPAMLPSNETTCLLIYGSVFFAAAQTIKASLPKVDETDHAVVILGLRGQSEIGSTFITTLWSYHDELQAHNSKLVIVGIDQDVREKFERTGFQQALGEENVFLATPQFGEAMNLALEAAKKWLDG